MKKALGSISYYNVVCFPRITIRHSLILLPQAAKLFMPKYKGAIISYLKGTAIVGYAAIEYLTKAGDITRSRTFEAFFPLLTIVLIYFLIAKTIIRLLNYIAPDFKPRKQIV